MATSDDINLLETINITEITPVPTLPEGNCLKAFLISYMTALIVTVNYALKLYEEFPSFGKIYNQFVSVRIVRGMEHYTTRQNYVARMGAVGEYGTYFELT